ncbi:MAG: hypothetical protein HFG73_06525 [Hungatella sp.]|nr:hypothetical protein [Hungatella sp.]
MAEKLERRLEGLFDHHGVLCVFFALIILTMLKAGNIGIIGGMGVMLCCAGLMQGGAKADMWILVPLILYNLFSAAASYVTFKNVVEGYASTQLIFPAVYLMMACMDEGELQLLRRLSALWAGAAACQVLLRFTWQAMDGGMGRAGGMLGNPNAMGIFLVLGWFLLQDGNEDRDGQECSPECGIQRPAAIKSLEPVLLAALALTLSMGSFLSMAAGIGVLAVQKAGRDSRKAALWHGIRVLAKASLAVGTGILMYIGSDQTDGPWICIVIFLYIFALAWQWERFDRFLKKYRAAAAAIAAMGFMVAAAAVMARPNSAYTFLERLAMMKNGLGYFISRPLLGVGPYQWRGLNLYDADPYFNTYHIHNVFVHVGAELGAGALAMMAAVGIRCFLKKKAYVRRAGCAAFLCHNLMDTGFFYPGIVVMAMIMGGEPGSGGRQLKAGTVRALFGGLGAVFAWNLYWYIRMT